MTSVQLPRLVCLAFLAAAVGCAGGGKFPAKASGRITYKDQTIKAGSMNFHSSSGPSFAGVIDLNGTYTATDLPAEEMVVTVETESVNPDPGKKKGAQQSREAKMGGQKAPPGAGPSPNELYVEIPKKYSDPKTSPLKTTLKRGNNSYDIVLTD
jgi:hypothetical protein